MVSKTRSLTLESGHTVRGICSSLSRSTSLGSSTQRTPWSIRDTFRSSRACQMYSGGPSSPAWATVSSPCSRASSKTTLNSSGGFPTSEESSPTPTIHSLYGSEQCRVSFGSSALRCLRKQDQGRGDTDLPLGIEHGAAYAHDNSLERHASAGVGLWVEEHFGTAHVLGRGFPQVGPCQIVEVLFVEEHLGRFVINVQKGLEVAEVVGAAHLLRRGVPESDPVALGEREHQLRLQRTLDMDVQLRLWHILDESL